MSRKITIFAHNDGKITKTEYDYNEFLEDCESPEIVDAILNGRFGEYKKQMRRKNNVN